MYDRGQTTLTVVLLSLVFAALACADTIWVDCNNCGDPDADGTPEHPFCTIQEGIDAAVDGDEVVVRDCTYTGDGNKNLDFSHGLPDGQTRAITVRSENGPNCCVIDCEGNGRGFYFHRGETDASVVHGFTISGGVAAGGDVGGGMLVSQSHPKVSDCVFSGNTAHDGGGMCIEASSRPTVLNCTFSGNTVWHVSGSDGAGIAVRDSSPMVVNCVFRENTARDDGAAMDIVWSAPRVINCVFFGNIAHGELDEQGGGAVSNWESDPTFTNCTFTQNTSMDNGGGIYNYHSNPTLINCILWGDTGAEIFDDDSSVTTVHYSDVQGGWPGEGNIDCDPQFVTPPR